MKGFTSNIVWGTFTGLRYVVVEEQKYADDANADFFRNAVPVKYRVMHYRERYTERKGNELQATRMTLQTRLRYQMKPYTVV